MLDPMRLFIGLIIAVVSLVIATVSAWIVGIRMRRRLRRDLGRKATDADLTSIDTWLEADEVEQRKRNKSLAPD